MNDAAPVLIDQATAASILDSLNVLESQAFDELGRLGAQVFTDSMTGAPKAHLDHAILYRFMAGGWPEVQEFRRELAHMNDEALLSAANLCEILNFVQWARICLARGDDIWHLFSVALERLSAVPIADLVAAWKQAGGQKRGGAAAPKRKVATVKLLEKILREDDDLRARDLWERVGSPTVNRYSHVEFDGERYEFEKGEAGDLAIYRISPEFGRQKLKRQPFNSTFRRWCKEARKNLSSPRS